MKSFLQSSAAVAALCAGVFLPALAEANVQTIVDSNSAVWGAAGGSFLNYKEPLSPIPDSQHGWLPSFAVGGGYMTNSKLYFAGDGSIWFGTDHYNGAVFNTSGNSFLYQGDSRETIVTVNGKAGYGFALGYHSLGDALS